MEKYLDALPMIEMMDLYIFSKQKQLLWQQEAPQGVGLFAPVHGNTLERGTHWPIGQVLRWEIWNLSSSTLQE